MATWSFYYAALQVAETLSATNARRLGWIVAVVVEAV